jgi:hypothetical protein
VNVARQPKKKKKKKKARQSSWLSRSQWYPEAESVELSERRSQQVGMTRTSSTARMVLHQP